MWTSHIIHTIKSYGLELAYHECTTNFVEEKATDKFGSNHFRMKIEIYFHPLLTPWTVTNEHTYTQKDGWNCGPIACLKLMEIWVSPQAFY